MATAMDVANFFLASNPRNSISNLKLQKLCAYAQALAVTYLGRKIFPENIEMWELGPVVREVYNKYKGHDNNPIPQTKLDVRPFSEQERFVLMCVNEHYARLYDAWGLCVQSHRDFPGVRGSNQVLTEEMLEQAFRDNHVVAWLRRCDATPLPDPSEKLLSEEEFWNAVSA